MSSYVHHHLKLEASTVYFIQNRLSIRFSVNFDQENRPHVTEEQERGDEICA